MILPEPIQNLISAFERLPGIGPKSASRLVFFLLRARKFKRALLGTAEDSWHRRMSIRVVRQGRSP